MTDERLDLVTRALGRAYSDGYAQKQGTYSSDRARDLLREIDAWATTSSTPEIVNRTKAATLPLGSLFVACDGDGKPRPRCHGFIAQWDHPLTLSDDQYRVLYRAPEPPVPLAVGDEVRDHAAAIALPAGTWLDSADGKVGFVHEDPHDHKLRHVTWSTGFPEQYDPTADVWPASVRGLPDGGAQ